MPTVTVIQPTIAEEKAVKIRCAAYCRVSSDSEDQLNSILWLRQGITVRF